MSFHRSAGVYVWCRTFCTSVQNIRQYTVTQVSRYPWYKTYLECRVVAFFSRSTSPFVIKFAKSLIWLLHFITPQFTSSTIDVLQSIVHERHSFAVASFPVLIAICCFTLCHSSPPYFLLHFRRKQAIFWLFSLLHNLFRSILVVCPCCCRGSRVIARGRLREILLGVNRTTL